MPYPVKGLLEVCEDMVEILLMLPVFLAEDPEIEYLFQHHALIAINHGKEKLFLNSSAFENLTQSPIKERQNLR